MKKAHLKWQISQDGIDFTVLDESQYVVGVNSWGLYDVAVGKESGSISSLLSLHNDGETKLTDQGLHLSHKQVAELDSISLAQLGLPSVAPFRLQVRGKGQIARPGFDLECKLLTTKGQPTLGLKRQGTHCTFAGKQYLLLDPLYSILEGVERFQRSEFSSVDAQMVAWGELKELLPSDAQVDNQLKTVNIVRADKFTLDLQEENNFVPKLMHSVIDQIVDSERIEPALPGVRDDSFQSQFKRWSEVRPHYALGGGWYAVVPKKVQKALQVVRKAQDRDQGGRKAFLANPMANIRDELLEEGYSQEQEEEVESIFAETKEFLSARIESIGYWEPKLCAYRLPTKNKWIPEDVQFTIVSGDRTVEVSKEEAEEVLPKLEEALEHGETEITIGDKQYPVTSDTVEAFTRIAGAGEKEAKDEPQKSKTKAPILKDNIDEEDYVALQRDKRGQAGGIPGILKTQPLYSHQQKGLDWLQTHWAQGTSGVLLADDMGLGKTLQALSFMAWVAESMENGSYSKKPFLVVAPTGLLKNWQDEVEKHLEMPGLGRVYEAFGKGISNLNNKTLLQRREVLENVDWVLTTYETLRDKIQYFITVEWGITIFDEAQKIKNPVSRMTEMAKSLESDFTVILTGTPVENELKDLWCIVDIAVPGFLGSLRDFHENFAIPAQEDPEAAKGLQDRLMKEVAPPLMLRRMKEDHLEGLPSKDLIVQREFMPAEQANSYEAIIQQAAQEKGKQGAMLKALQNMRSCSLFCSDVENEGLCDAKIEKSARLKAAISMLDKIYAKDEKALIFLESLKLQELLIPYLQKRYQMPHPPQRISGKDSGLNRKKRVDAFQSLGEGIFDVMILSPKAGGVGLTLTAANHLIHLSRWWNPAVEDQCTDRIFRIGQKKPVYIYYPLAVHPEYGENSFDINLHMLLEKKRTLSRSVLVPHSVTEDDYRELFDRSVS